MSERLGSRVGGHIGEVLDPFMYFLSRLVLLMLTCIQNITRMASVQDARTVSVPPNTFRGHYLAKSILVLW